MSLGFKNTNVAQSNTSPLTLFLGLIKPNFNFLTKTSSTKNCTSRSVYEINFNQERVNFYGLILSVKFVRTKSLIWGEAKLHHKLPVFKDILNDLQYWI